MPSRLHRLDEHLPGGYSLLASTGPALLVGDWAFAQLWLLWLVPLVGAALAGFPYKALLEGPSEPAITGR